MRFEDLFEQRSFVASRLKECLLDKGYTKFSFAKKSGIAKPTLERLLNGEIDDKSTFDKHMKTILDVLNMSANELLLFNSEIKLKAVGTVYSENVLDSYEMSEKAVKQYNLLLGILDLCEIYY